MYKNGWCLPPNAVIGVQVCVFNEVGVTVDLRPCLWKTVAGVGGRFPSNRATELTNQINITLASDLGACFSGTAVPLVCPRERSPLCPDVPTVPTSSAQKIPNVAQTGIKQILGNNIAFTSAWVISNKLL